MGTGGRGGLWTTVAYVRLNSGMGTVYPRNTQLLIKHLWRHKINDNIAVIYALLCVLWEGVSPWECLPACLPETSPGVLFLAPII